MMTATLLYERLKDRLHDVVPDVELR